MQEKVKLVFLKADTLKKENAIKNVIAPIIKIPRFIV